MSAPGNDGLAPASVDRTLGDASPTASQPRRLTANASPALSVIVVHWRTERDLGALLAAMPDDARFEIVVVDNSGTAAFAPSPRVRLVRPGPNLGFGGGANLGATISAAPLLLVANPDVRPERGALEALLAGFDALPEAAGLAPRLVSVDGTPQTAWQLRELPRPAQLLQHALFRDASRGAATQPAAGQAVAQPAAAALALRRSAWEQLGGFDSTFHPAWFEDVDLARRLASAGGTIAYWPDATFRHGLGGSVGPLGYGAFLWHYHRNLGRYLRKHHGRGWAAAARTLLVVGATLRALLLPLRRPGRARSRREALAALAAVVLGAITNWRRPRRLARAESGG